MSAVDEVTIAAPPCPATTPPATTMPGGTPPPGTPVVLFCDAGTLLGAFLTWAAALRRRGFRVELLTPAGTSPRRLLLADRAVFHAVHTHDEGTTPTVPAGLLPNLVDIQAVETVRPVLPGPAPHLVPRVRAAADAAVLLDKPAMNALAADTGWLVPRSWLPEELADAESQDLPWPLVVKNRTGFGGDGMCLVHDAAELRGALAAAAAPVLVQERVVGPVVKLGGVADRGELVEWGCYRAMPAEGDPFGTPADVLTVTQPGLEEPSRALVRRLGLSGPFNVDCIEDVDGRVWFLELNSRAWGSWPCLDRAGLDQVGAFQRTVGIPAPAAVAREVRIGLRTRVPSSTSGLDELWLFRRQLGLRWFAASVAHHDLTALARGGSGRRRHRAGTGPGTGAGAGA
ncbi:MAG: biotin carboxylase [Mycobacterium sp.]|nr:biotin carboxylase [Mycobacterium sp.]